MFGCVDCDTALHDCKSGTPVFHPPEINTACIHCGFLLIMQDSTHVSFNGRAGELHAFMVKQV